MNVLFLSTEFPGPHDPVRAVFNLRMCEALSTVHAVRVVSPVAWTERLTRVAPAGDAPALRVTRPTYYFPPGCLHAERGRFMWWSIRHHLAAMCAEWRPDIVLSYWAPPDGETASRLAEQLRVPFVQMVGGSDVLLLQRDARRRRRVRAVLLDADAVITMGRHLAASVAKLGVPPQRITSMYRPIDDRRFTPGSRRRARETLGLAADGPLLLWVGRFVPVKGVDTLVRAVAAIRASHPHARVVLLGAGPQEDALRALVHTLRLDDAVRFQGPVPHDELADWYRAANVTVLPSFSEGVPNVLLESMACGVPFVASHVGGIPEIADAGFDRLVTPGDVAGLAGALVDVLAHDGRSRRRAMQPASPAVFVRQLESVFDRVLRDRSAVELAS